MYWRRRVTVLLVVFAVLGAAGWTAYAFSTGRLGGRTAAAPVRPAAETSPASLTPSLASARAVPCATGTLTVEVRADGTAVSGQPATLNLVVRNGSTVPCTFDGAPQEVVLLDAAGHRIWSSVDCPGPGTPDASGTRTLAAGESVEVAVAWNGLTSEPTCTAAQVAVPAGSYVLRGRLDTTVTQDVPLTVH